MRYLQREMIRNVIQGIFTLICCFSVSALFSAGVPSDGRIVIDSLGNQVAVWEVATDATSTIQSSIFTTSWSSPTTISTTSPAFGAQVMANEAGNTVAAWLALDTDNQVYCLSVSTLSPITGWSTPTVLSASNENVGQFELKINSVGQAVLIWSSMIGSSTGVWTNTALTFGGGWGTSAQLF